MPGTESLLGYRTTYDAPYINLGVKSSPPYSSSCHLVFRLFSSFLVAGPYPRRKLGALLILHLLVALVELRHAGLCSGENETEDRGAYGERR